MNWQFHSIKAAFQTALFIQRYKKIVSPAKLEGFGFGKKNYLKQ